MIYTNSDPTAVHHANQELLPMWVIYRNPADHPGKWVARMWATLPRARPTPFKIIGDGLQELRNALPPGLSRVDRDPNDDPKIVETWL